jgi:hypothetical protein
MVFLSLLLQIEVPVQEILKKLTQSLIAVRFSYGLWRVNFFTGEFNLIKLLQPKITLNLEQINRGFCLALFGVGVKLGLSAPKGWT